MADTQHERGSVADDLGRLLAAMPDVVRLPVDNPIRQAFAEWGRVLLAQVAELEERARAPDRGSYLWITDALRDQAPTPDNRTDESDTLSDVARV